MKPTIVFLSHIDMNLYLFRLPVMETLVKEGWDVVALVPSGEYSSRFHDHGIRHVDYAIDRGSLNPFKELLTIWRITKALKQIRPVILHAFTVKPNLYGILAARLAGVPHSVATVTGLGSFFIDHGLKARLVRSLIVTFYRLIFPIAGFVIFQNHDDHALFLEKRIVSHRHSGVVLGSGIDTALWQRSRPLGTTRPLTVLYIGRLVIHKGIGEFARAAQIVQNDHPGLARFLVAGDFYDGNPFSIDQTWLEHLADEGVVTLLGWREDIKALLDEADIFVLPSYREGLPRTGIEAASMGMPIVTTDTVGCKETVAEGVNGFLVPVKDHTLLAQTITTLLQNDALRQEMGHASREMALERFDVRAVIKGYRAVYSALTGMAPQEG